MEDLTFGLIKGVECKFAKSDPDVVESIAQKTMLTPEKVKSMLRYNIYTINQFAIISQLSVSTILNKTRPTIINGAINTELDYCYPFQDVDSDGPKFILRNEKSEKYLRV